MTRAAEVETELIHQRVNYSHNLSPQSRMALLSNGEGGVAF